MPGKMQTLLQSQAVIGFMLVASRIGLILCQNTGVCVYDSPRDECGKLKLAQPLILSI